VQASNKVGVPCIGLLSGGIGRDELRDAGAAEIYDDPAALLETVRERVPGRVLGRRNGD
jgi:phosphoglycolate phosphatase-like HAD superfamily hydrolase